MDQVKELSQELGYPSANKLWAEVRKRGIQVSRMDVLRLVRSQGMRQVFRARPKYEGRITAVEINDRWVADLIDYNAQPSQDPKGGPPYQYILIVQDIFSRVLFAHALKTKSPEVCQQAFESIVRRAGLPDQLDTDNGNEWKGPFDEYLRDERIRRVVSDSRNKNARATLDSAIKSIRHQLARILLAEKRKDWASVLQRAIEAHNKTIHASLIGRAPYQVYWDKDLTFNLRKKAADDIAHNSKLIERRGQRLENVGAFRTEEVIKNKFERIFTPRFSDTTHRVQKVVGPMVYDEQGNAYPTRHVIPVDVGSTNVDTRNMGGSERIDRVRLQSLEPYRKRIEDFVGQGKTENEVVRYMKSIGMTTLTNAGFNFRKMLVLLGYTVGQGRGSSTAIVKKVADTATVATAPTPAEAGRNLRTRITGKRPPV
jgi:hypothetical protein